MMRFILERVADPDIEPVTLEEMKLHLRVTNTTENDLITSLIVVAREWVERYTGRALIDQTWRLTIEQRPIVSGESVGGYRQGTGYYTTGWFRWERVGEIMLRRAPVLALTSFVTVDSDGVETPVAADTYALREANSRWPRIVALSGATWSTENSRIAFRAGFAERTGSPQQTAAVVPARFKQAVKLIVGHLYENRESVLVGVGGNRVTATELPMGVRWLLQSEKSELGFA
jgi:uncharacterized phiE125 gp8 family phage protein